MKKWIELLRKTRPDLVLRRLEREQQEEKIDRKLSRKLLQRDAEWTTILAAAALKSVSKSRSETKTYEMSIAAVRRKFQDERISAPELARLKRDIDTRGDALLDAVKKRVREPEYRDLDVKQLYVSVMQVIDSYY